MNSRAVGAIYSSATLEEVAGVRVRLEPAALPGVLVSGRLEEMAMRWRSTTDQTDAMLGTGHDDTVYAAGWTISGLATIATIVAIWMFEI
ncbi:hypothetical protein [Bradyrhizobium sp. USDA 10063]